MPPAYMRGLAGSSTGHLHPLRKSGIVKRDAPEAVHFASPTESAGPAMF